MGIPAVNVQALVAIALFIVSLFVARAVMNIYRGKWPGGTVWLFYLRMLLGFLLTGAIVFSFYSFAGIDIITRN